MVVATAEDVNLGRGNSKVFVLTTHTGKEAIKGGTVGVHAQN